MSDGPRLAASRPGLTLPTTGVMVRLAGAARGVRAAAARAVPGLAFLALIGLWTACHVTELLRQVVAFPGHEGDGPFQLFNPLRRIAAGQTGGVDFQYFHGLGLPYLHYPIYAAAGRDLYASELARHLVALAAYLGTTFAVCFAVGRRLTPTLGLAALSLVVVDQIGLNGLSTAGNGAMGVRSMTPFFVFAVLLAGFRPRVEAVVVGLVAGAGVLVGLEHGVATLGMIGVVWLGRRITGLPGRSVAWAGAVLGLCALTAGAGLVAIGGPAGAAAALRFAFREMPHDQFWYFGVPPNPFMHRWVDVATDRWLLVRAAGPFAVVAVLAVRRATAHPEDRPAVVAVFGLLAYGSIALAAYFGYSSIHYLEPLTRVALAGGLLLGWRMWGTLPEAGPVAEPLRRGVRTLAAAAVVVLLLAGPAPQHLSSVSYATYHARSIGDSARTIRDGRCRMTPKVQAELDAMVTAIDADRAGKGITRPPVLWSTYAGRLEDHYGVFHPYCDYAIHALGPVRRAAYLESFRTSRPDYVVTFRPSAFDWEVWLRNSTWELYEDIVRNYDVLPTKQERFAVWRRKPGDWVTVDPAAGRVTRAADAPDWFMVPAPPGCAANAPRVVEIEYEVRRPAAGVPFVGGLPRHLLGPAWCDCPTAISLPPYRTTWSFPVFPTSDRPPEFFAKTFSLTGGSVTIKKVHVRPLPVTPEQVYALTR